MHFGGNLETKSTDGTAVTAGAWLFREEVERIVPLSPQYVAMFNVNQKLIRLDPASGGMFMEGFNRPKP
jgi:hypothetical protein